MGQPVPDDRHDLPLFFLVIAMPIALLTDVESMQYYWLTVQAIVVASFVLASIVVWSETVPWIGAPESGSEDGSPSWGYPIPQTRTPVPGARDRRSDS